MNPKLLLQNHLWSCAASWLSEGGGCSDKVSMIKKDRYVNQWLSNKYNRGYTFLAIQTSAEPKHHKNVSLFLLNLGCTFFTFPTISMLFLVELSFYIITHISNKLQTQGKFGQCSYLHKSPIMVPLINDVCQELSYIDLYQVSDNSSLDAF